MKTTLNADRDAPLPRPIVQNLRTTKFEPPRRRWPGILAASVLAAGIAAAAVSSLYGSRSQVQHMDAGVAGAAAVDQVRESVPDTNITAAVKASLATDPQLSALTIEVTTTEGVVHLKGPAPDGKSRERAEVLAAAPRGVVSVVNQLVVAP